jgi:2-oxoglutarate ferredoxin oxidoreductase subunit beta
MAQVLSIASEWGSRIPIGIFYQNEFVPTYHKRIVENIPKYEQEPPAAESICTAEGLPLADLSKQLASMKLDT